MKPRQNGFIFILLIFLVFALIYHAGKEMKKDSAKIFRQISNYRIEKEFRNAELFFERLN